MARGGQQKCQGRFWSFRVLFSQLVMCIYVKKLKTWIDLQICKNLQIGTSLQKRVPGLTCPSHGVEWFTSTCEAPTPGGRMRLAPWSPSPSSLGEWINKTQPGHAHPPLTYFTKQPEALISPPPFVCSLTTGSSPWWSYLKLYCPQKHNRLVVMLTFKKPFFISI